MLIAYLSYFALLAFLLKEAAQNKINMLIAYLSYFALLAFLLKEAVQNNIKIDKNILL